MLGITLSYSLLFSVSVCPGRLRYPFMCNSRQARHQFKTHLQARHRLFGDVSPKSSQAKHTCAIVLSSKTVLYHVSKIFRWTAAVMFQLRTVQLLNPFKNAENRHRQHFYIKIVFTVLFQIMIVFLQ